MCALPYTAFISCLPCLPVCSAYICEICFSKTDFTFNSFYFAHKFERIFAWTDNLLCFQLVRKHKVHWTCPKAKEKLSNDSTPLKQGISFGSFSWNVLTFSDDVWSVQKFLTLPRIKSSKDLTKIVVGIVYYQKNWWT